MTRTYAARVTRENLVTPDDVPPTRVIVVGAGLAGVTAANALVNAGIATVVLEARDRVGGRLHSVRLGGFAVDLGGSWIHEPVGNPLTELCDDLGIGRWPGDFPGRALGWDAADGPIDEPRLHALLDHAEVGFAEATPELLADLGPDATVADGIARYATTHAAGDDRLERQLASMLRLYIEADSGTPSERIALRDQPPSTVTYDGSYLGELPVGGYQALVEGLASGLDIRSDCWVSSITCGPSGVGIRTLDGTRHEASHVIVTVPLGVLQAGSIAFDPPLPEERLGAIGRLGMGRMEKLICRFDRSWWAPSGFRHLIQIDSDGSADALPLIVGFDDIAREPILMAMAHSSTTGSIADGTISDAVQRLRATLRSILGIDVPAPTHAVRSDWTNDPLSRGCYACVPIGADRSDLDMLGEPLFDGRLLFAGEATAATRVGFADGAFSSGVREAGRLLGVDSVRIGRL